jgi:hypothetical protein
VGRLLPNTLRPKNDRRAWPRGSLTAILATTGLQLVLPLPQRTPSNLSGKDAERSQDLNAPQPKTKTLRQAERMQYLPVQCQS